MTTDQTNLIRAAELLLEAAKHPEQKWEFRNTELIWERRNLHLESVWFLSHNLDRIRKVEPPKPPTYRPYKSEEVPVGSVVIAKPSRWGRWVIGGATGDSVYLSNNHDPISMAKLLDHYTHPDGSPCGVLETEGGK